MYDMLAPGKWSLVDARLGPTPRRGHSICVARVQGEESALLFGGMQAGTQTAGLHPSSCRAPFLSPTAYLLLGLYNICGLYLTFIGGHTGRRGASNEVYLLPLDNRLFAGIHAVHQQ
jgi:hypothetical protein